MAVDMTAAECERIFHAALSAGDAEGVVASLRLMTVIDPHRAQTLYDMTRLALAIAGEETRTDG